MFNSRLEIFFVWIFEALAHFVLIHFVVVVVLFFGFFCSIFIYLFIYLLFLAVLGPHCCAQAFSSCGEHGLLSVVVRGLLISVASPVAEHRL